MSDKYIEDNVLLTVLKTLGKVILFLLFIVLFFVLGLFIGYSIIGDGNYWEVLNQDTWQHILDFIRWQNITNKQMNWSNDKSKGFYTLGQISVKVSLWFSFGFFILKDSVYPFRNDLSYWSNCV